MTPKRALHGGGASAGRTVCAVVPDSKELKSITAPPSRLQPIFHSLCTLRRLVRPAAKGRRRPFGAPPERPDASSASDAAREAKDAGRTVFAVVQDKITLGAIATE